MKVLYYFDIGSSTVKTATHARFDEGMNDLDTPPPNVKLLRNLASDGVVDPDTINLSTADLDISDDPFERLDTLTQPLTCEHETLGFEVKECHIRRRGYVSAILPNTSASRIRNDSMEKHNMYGTPTFPPPDAIILRQHWNYAIKGD